MTASPRRKPGPKPKYEGDRKAMLTRVDPVLAAEFQVYCVEAGLSVTEGLEKLLKDFCEKKRKRREAEGKPALQPLSSPPEATQEAPREETPRPAKEVVSSTVGAAPFLATLKLQMSGGARGQWMIDDWVPSYDAERHTLTVTIPPGLKEDFDLNLSDWIVYQGETFFGREGLKVVCIEDAEKRAQLESEYQEKEEREKEERAARSTEAKREYQERQVAVVRVRELLEAKTHQAAEEVRSLLTRYPGLLDVDFQFSKIVAKWISEDAYQSSKKGGRR